MSLRGLAGIFKRWRLIPAAGAAAFGMLATGGLLETLRAEPLLRPDAVVEFLTPAGATVARLVVEIADTPAARTVGLMGRVLGDHTGGMLFVFDQPEPQSFWMRNTPSSLDMIFVDAQGRVLNIAAGTTPLSDTSYASKGSAQFVVEAKAGFAARYGIREGYRITWKPIGE